MGSSGPSWGRRPQPYYFTRRDGAPISFAGLWDIWNDRENGGFVQSCAMVITEPNAFVAEVHDRMPVILEPADFEQWERGDTADAAALMKPAGEDVLQKWPVSKRVNSSRADDNDASLIEANKIEELGQAIDKSVPADMGKIADLFGIKR